MYVLNALSMPSIEGGAERYESKDREWAIAIMRDGEVRVLPKEDADTSADILELLHVFKTQKEAKEFKERIQYEKGYRDIFLYFENELGSEELHKAIEHAGGSLLSHGLTLRQQFRESSWYLQKQWQKDAAIRSLEVFVVALEQLLETTLPTLARIRDGIRRFVELEMTATNEYSFSLHENTFVQVTVRGYASDGPEMDIVFYDDRDGRLIDLRQFGFDGTRFIVQPVGEAGDITCDVLGGHVNIPSSVIPSLDKYIFVLAHELGHTYQREEIGQLNVASAGEDAVRLITKMELDAWDRAKMIADEILGKGFDISVPVGGADGLERLKKRGLDGHRICIEK